MAGKVSGQRTNAKLLQEGVDVNKILADPRLVNGNMNFAGVWYIS
jgi:hypothetical protein